MATDFQDNESDVHYKLGLEQSPRRSEDEDLDSDLDVCLLDDASSDIRKNMSDVPDEDLSDDLLHSDEEELTICYNDTVDSSQVTTPLKPPLETHEEIPTEIRESPLSPGEGPAVDPRGSEEPEGKVISGQDEESGHSSAANATAAEDSGKCARDQESEDEAVDVEINEPFDDEFQVIEIKEQSDLEASTTAETTKESCNDEDDESNEEEEDEQSCHSRFKSERKEGMVVVRLSHGARQRRNIPDTLELSGDCRTGARDPARRHIACGGAGGRRPPSNYLMLSRMEVRGFDPRPQPQAQRSSVQPPLPSHPRPRAPQQRYFSPPQSYSQPGHQGRAAPQGPARSVAILTGRSSPWVRSGSGARVLSCVSSAHPVPLMCAQSQAKPAVAPQCLSGVAAAGPSHFPQPLRSQHAEPWRGQAPPKERRSSEPLVPGQHMLDQWRCPRPLDCSPRLPGQSHRRPPPPLRPRMEQRPWLGPALESGSGSGSGSGPGREMGRQAGLGQPLAGHREPLRSPLPPPAPYKMALNSGQLHSRPFLPQSQVSPQSCSPTSEKPTATPCVPVHPARSKVTPCFTKPSAFADAAPSHTQSPVQAQAQVQPRPRIPGLPPVRSPARICSTDALRPTLAPAAQVRPITRGELSAKPAVVARGVTATAVPVPVQRAKAEAAASSAPEPRAPVRNVGQKVKEEPPSPVRRARSPPAEACVKAEEKEDEETQAYREKMEEQKRKRMEVLRQKELRRQLQAKEKRMALQESTRMQRVSQGPVEQQRWPRECGQPWGQAWAAQPYQRAQREFPPPPPPCQFDSEDTFFQGPDNMGPVHFREVPRDGPSPEGPASFQQSQRGPAQSWTDRLQQSGVQPPQQPSPQRGIQVQCHIVHEGQPNAELRLGPLSSDAAPRSLQGPTACQPQPQVMPAPPAEPSDSAELLSDDLESGPWPPLDQDEQRWFRPPKIWTPPWRPQKRMQPWVLGEEQEPVLPIRPMLKRTVAQREDHCEDEGRPPVKVIRHITTEEEHRAQCFSTRGIAVKHQDHLNVTRLITVGRPLQQPDQLQNMQDMDDRGGVVCHMLEQTGLWRRCTNSLPNSNLIVKINY
ncbi:RNA-binding protein 33-like isoform X1 [Alosa sapidissima]|uniref:RNA-binding protein 33-like isoform X1 n=1 Tax=Alosa sapidissima TaxID=34773 RepID=UPI001C0868B1|nr:RNA-binding protein 33-like isoform X1 [Alosa sapidissima]